MLLPENERNFGRRRLRNRRNGRMRLDLEAGQLELRIFLSPSVPRLQNPEKTPAGFVWIAGHGGSKSPSISKERVVYISIETTLAQLVLSDSTVVTGTEKAFCNAVYINCMHRKCRNMFPFS